MNGYFSHVMLFVLLAIGFGGICFGFGDYEKSRRLLRRTRDEIGMRSRKRLLERRRALADPRGRDGFWGRIEKLLEYSGIRSKLGGIPAEFVFFVGIAISLLAGGVSGLLMGAFFGCMVFVALLVIFALVLSVLRQINLRRVNNNLIRFLDFLGNYSLSNAELAAVLLQIAPYMDEPLSGALEQTGTEIQLTGDIEMALLGLADRIEHPQFKQLIRNLEVTVRYSADLSVLVADGRKGMREYLHRQQENKNLLYEAAINMILLMLMSFLTLVIVDGLIEISIWHVVFGTTVGYIACGICAGILVLFLRQLFKVSE